MSGHRRLWGAGAAVGIALLLAAVARRALVFVEVDGPSMAPTLSAGDRVLVLRAPFSRPVRRGDIVAARMPDQGMASVPAGARGYDWVVKRVAAVENDQLPGALGTDLRSVPPHHVFLLGDGARSFDSRHWGPVQIDALLGRAIWRIPSQYTAGRSGHRRS